MMTRRRDTVKGNGEINYIRRRTEILLGCCWSDSVNYRVQHFIRQWTGDGEVKLFPKYVPFGIPLVKRRGPSLSLSSRRQCSGRAETSAFSIAIPPIHDDYMAHQVDDLSVVCNLIWNSQITQQSFNSCCPGRCSEIITTNNGFLIPPRRRRRSLFQLVATLIPIRWAG